MRCLGGAEELSEYLSGVKNDGLRQEDCRREDRSIL